MTSRGSRLINRPFLLKPVAKNYLWGGRRLNDEFSKGIAMYPLAETWECSTHPDGISMVASGEYRGMLLSEVLEQHPEYIGTHPGTRGELPILIKLIDARYNLSVQVHPDDEYAMEHEDGQPGKTEMWYVIDADRNSEIVYGFLHDISEDKLRNSINEGTIEKHLRKVRIKKDDVFYIKSGTVHAIGAGVLLAEIQQNSNLTYRLYDYNRRDYIGSKRKLHIDKAIAVADLRGSIEPRQPMRVLKYRRGCASELLCRCQYFEVERWLINTERYRNMTDIRTDSNSFQVLLCIRGCGALIEENGDFINVFKGDCIFIPADSVRIKLHGRMQLLRVIC